MYDPHTILSSVDRNAFAFIAIGSVAMLFNYMYFVGAALAARRDRTYTFPLFCTTIWFAHDLSFVLLYDQWFNVYRHWYVELFWVALIPTTIAEVGFIYQTWLYGKKEVMPASSSRAWLAYILLAVLAGAIAWWSLKDFLADPIYAYTFGATGNMAPAFIIGRIIVRGDARGQSVTTWLSYTCMQICWFSAAIAFFGPAFREPWYLAMALASVGGGLGATALVYRYRRREVRESPAVIAGAWRAAR